jgi:hypothetical protein
MTTDACVTAALACRARGHATIHVTGRVVQRTAGQFWPGLPRGG